MSHGTTPLVMNEYDRKVNKMYDSDVELSVEPFTEESFIAEINKVRENLKPAAKKVVFEHARTALLELVTAIDCYQEQDFQLIASLLDRACDYIDWHWKDTSGQVFAVNARKARIGIQRIINRWHYNERKGMNNE